MQYLRRHETQRIIGIYAGEEPRRNISEEAKKDTNPLLKSTTKHKQLPTSNRGPKRHEKLHVKKK